jgi:hypothetical protein
LLAEAFITTIVSTQRSEPSFGDDVLDLGLFGDAVIAPAVPCLHHQRLAGHQLGIEGGVVIGEQGFLGRDQSVLDLGHLGRVGFVDRIALVELAGGQQPAVGRQHGGLALQRFRRIEQVAPAVGAFFDQIGAIAETRRAPGIGDRA